jgi:hypothetical protein
VSSETFFHHLFKDTSCFDKVFIHRYKFSYKTASQVNRTKTYSLKPTSLLAVFVDELDNLWSQSHTRSVQFLEKEKGFKKQGAIR